MTPWRGEVGKGRMGCLFLLFIVVCTVYVIKDVGPVYLRYYQMRDEVKTQASFAPALTDKAIRDRLVVKADTLGVPLGPKQWSIGRTRQPSEIVIRGAYDDSAVIEVLSLRKVLHFHFVFDTRAPL